MSQATKFYSLKCIKELFDDGRLEQETWLGVAVKVHSHMPHVVCSLIFLFIFIFSFLFFFIIIIIFFL